MNKSKNIFILGVVLFLSIVFSYIILEDTIGGAKNDFVFHKKFIILFAEDFKNTFNGYGKGELLARNSPVFYIFLSLIYKSGIDLDNIKYLNIISIPLLVYVFYSCLKIQFRGINTNLLIFFFIRCFSISYCKKFSGLALSYFVGFNIFSFFNKILSKIYQSEKI